MRNGLIIDKYKDKYWYKDDLLHREDGPAIEMHTGYKAWCINGNLHREDGPAVEYANGHREWWTNDEYIECSSNEEFLRLVKLKALW